MRVSMKCPTPLPGQGGALALVCQILRPRGWEICRNLYLFIREHMLHVVSTFDPGGGSFDTRHLANPHPTPGGGVGDFIDTCIIVQTPCPFDYCNTTTH